MTIIKRDKCDICGRQRVSTVASDGRFLGRFQWVDM